MSRFSEILVEMLDERVPAAASPEAHVIGLAQILRDPVLYQELCRRAEGSALPKVSELEV